MIAHEPLGFHDYNCLQMYSFCCVSDSGTLPEESSFFHSIGYSFPAVCIRTSTERSEALDKGNFILSGIGSGTRLYPLTKITSKQLLPIYDKPMIRYPMYILMSVGIRDILIISTPWDAPCFRDLLGNGQQFGISLTYAVQSDPDGLAQAYIIGEDFIGDSLVAMVLGDNIFAGHGLKKRLQNAVNEC